MAQAVDQRQAQDRPVLSQERVGQDGSQDRKEIDARIEGVIPGHGVRVTHRGRSAARVHQVLRHEDDEDALHAVEAESLGRFISDDVGDAGRHPVGCDGAGWVVVVRHPLSFSDYLRKRAGPRNLGRCSVFDIMAGQVLANHNTDQTVGFLPRLCRPILAPPIPPQGEGLQVGRQVSDDSPLKAAELVSAAFCFS